MFIVASSCKRCQKRDSIFNGQKPQCTGHELCMPVSLKQIGINYPKAQTAGIGGPWKKYFVLVFLASETWACESSSWMRFQITTFNVWRENRVRMISDLRFFLSIICQGTSNQHVIIILISPKHESKLSEKNLHIMWNDYCLGAIINNDLAPVLGSKTNEGCPLLMLVPKSLPDSVATSPPV